jgi:predicted dinucleotide-binding enzyme
MKIGILGTGHIGKTLAQKLSAAGHDVKVANSRGPDTISADALSTGARAVRSDEVVRDVDVVILSIPLNRIPDVAPLFADVPEDAVVIDTSNYYPMRDGKIEALEAGQVESEWVAEQLGRPIAKAWNAIGSDSFAKKGAPGGRSYRLAIPVAADRENDRKVTMALVEETGLDAYDAGAISDSWRQQPGAPVYCTDLSLAQMLGAIERANKAVLPERREQALAEVSKLLEAFGGTNPEWTDLVRVNRALFM